MYFHHTEAIAGIRDARFQTMMPDALPRPSEVTSSLAKELDGREAHRSLVLHEQRVPGRHADSCGVDVLRKYEAITGAGIQVMKRVDLPDDFIKAFPLNLWKRMESGQHAGGVGCKDREWIPFRQGGEMSWLVAFDHRPGSRGGRGNLNARCHVCG